MQDFIQNIASSPYTNTGLLVAILIVMLAAVLSDPRAIKRLLQILIVLALITAAATLWSNLNPGEETVSIPKQEQTPLQNP